MRKTFMVMLGLALIAGGTAAAADDKPTSLTDARAAVEANLKTPEGKAYDEKLGKEFLEKQLATMKQCKQSAGNDLESFWILMKLDKDGAVKEVLLHPTTKLGGLRAGSAAQERVLAAAQARALGERLHEVDALRCGMQHRVPFRMDWNWRRREMEAPRLLRRERHGSKDPPLQLAG